MTVSTETQAIADGITARVVRDTVTEDGELIEDTLDWYAQDRAGNIWYLGEDTVELDGGAVTSSAGSLEAGVDGALPGIALPADATDAMTYRQEYYAGEPRTTARWWQRRIRSTSRPASTRTGS